MIPHILFERVAGQYPNNIAIEDAGERISYQVLNERANVLASLLREIGLDTERIVVVLLPLSGKLVTSMLAIFKAGGIYLPVDTGFSEKRFTQILTRTCHGLVIVSDDLYPTMIELVRQANASIQYFVVLGKTGVRIVNGEGTIVKEVSLDDTVYCRENQDHGISGDDSNYIFYTSGSTGEGKAVVGSHKSLHHYINWVNNEFDIRPNYRIGHLSQATFDASLKDIFMALGVGGTLCIPSSETKGNPDKLAEWIDSSGIAIFQTVPSVFRMLIKELSLEGAKKYSFTELKHVMLDGEPLYSKDITSWRQLAGDHAELVNLYGTTETTILDTFHRIGEVPENPSAVLHVGKPIDKTFILIISENKLCPIGKTGEVYIKTPYLTKGYYQDLALTEGSFVQNPLIHDKKDIVYRTGDLGRYLKDRNIEILGRKDQQVKVNGIRVELGEIQQAVLSVMGVSEAIVMLHQQNLICYFTSSVISIDALKQSLEKLLNRNVMPAYFVKLENFPLNINGKIDRKALPLPEAINETAAYEPPVNEVEATIERIWKEILGLSRISRKISFFTIGGHSLKAMRAISRIDKELNCRLEFKHIFAYPTIAELALLINETGSQLFEQISKIPHQEYYDVSHSQKRLWVLSQFKEGLMAYNVTAAVELKGVLRQDAIEKSFETIVSRHESLRTTFITVGGEPKQKINSVNDLGFKVLYIDLRGFSQPKEKVKELADEETRIAFDLEHGPLFKVSLLHVAGDHHILLLSMHHIISDGWSIEVVVKDFTVLYNAFCLGQSNPLAPLRIQYKDYASWQSSRLSGDALKNQHVYWHSQFSGDLPVLALNGDYQRPAVKTYNGNRISFVLNHNESTGVKKIGQQCDASLFMTLLAFINALLYRYTTQEDIIVGTPIAGREHLDLEDQIGLYVNTLALRTRFSGNDSFSDLLENVKTTTLEAYTHQLYPFDKLVDGLKLNRDTSRSALFDVMVVLHNTELEQSELMLNGLQVVGYGQEATTSKFDLTFTFKEVGPQIIGMLEYNTDIFSIHRIENIITHFKGIISSVLNDTNPLLYKLDYLSVTEKQKLLATTIEIDFPRHKTIHELFEHTVSKTPQAIAVVLGDQYLTYQDLNDKSNQLACYLRKHYNPQPDDLIGLMMDRSPMMIVSIMGILKAGCAYVPIDPAYPQNRVTYILNDASVKLVITDHGIADLKTDGVNWLNVNETEQNINSCPSRNEISIAKSQNLAYIIYTSGSTGQPKGVMVEHGNVVRLLINDSFQFHFGKTDVWTQFHSVCFDFSVWEIFGCLLYGGKLVLIDREVSLNAKVYVDTIVKEGVTVLNHTPGMFNTIMSEILQRQKTSIKLRYIIFGGEALKPTSLKKWYETYPETKLINMYGITETTVHVTYKEIGLAEITSGTSNIGKPIPTVSVYILDDSRQLVPVGVVGEIVVGGEGVARGYLNRDSLTNEKFIINPYKITEKLYCSGDLGMYDQHGDLIYIGRRDDQVKIRGYRIEIGEVENALLSNQGIEQAVVVAKNDLTGEKQLIAYYNATMPVSVSELRNYLSAHLPSYMIPVHFIEVKEFTLTANGKIDHKALPEVSLNVNFSRVIAPGRNTVEQFLVATWEKVLGRKGVSIDDNFYEIGGDSIKAIQISSRMYTEGYKIEVKDIFLHNTIASLSPYVTALETSIDQSVVEGTVLLTPIQKYFFQNNAVESHHYNQAIMLSFPGELDETGIRKTMSRLQEHHDALRMVYVQDEQGIQQINAGLEHPVCVEVYDLRKENEPLVVLEAIANEIQQRASLAYGPLFRSALIRIPKEDRLLIVSHHLVIDTVSWRILIEDIQTLLHQHEHSLPFILPIKTDSFKKWAEKLKEYADSELFLEEKSYWYELEGNKIEPLPKDKGHLFNFRKDAISKGFALTIDETALLLTRVNSAFNTDINDILLTSLALGLYEVFGHKKFLIGLEGHGRESVLNEVNISRTVGWFTSLYPVLLKINYPEDLSRQIREVKEHLHRVPNKGIGYGILKYLTALKNKEEFVFNLNPEISFNYLGQFDADVSDKSFSLTSESLGHSMSPEGSREFNIDVTGLISDGKLFMSFTFNRHHYQEAVMQQLCSACMKWLGTVITFCADQKNRIKTPTDFTYQELSIKTVEALCEKHSVEDIYPLSSLQEGMLFHGLLEKSDSYFTQISYRVKGAMDMGLIRQSYAELMKRHAVLRTIFSYKLGERPLQIVLQECPIDFYHEDISNLVDQDQYIEIYKQEDKSRGFDCEKDVLIRLAVLQTHQDHYEFIWSFHHILMDGWCLSILSTEFFSLYEYYLYGGKYPLKNPTPYKVYINWLEKVNKKASENFWRTYLEGYDAVATIPRTYANDKTVRYQNKSFSFSISPEKVQAVNHLAGKLKVTLSNFYQSLWGVLLARYNDTCDVVFGKVIAGRPSTIEGIESMIGLFINTIPVRIRFVENQSFGALVTTVQHDAIENEPYQYYSLAAIQSVTSLKQNLLDHLFIFENYPLSEQIEGVGHTTDRHNEEALSLYGMKAFEQTNYDFNVIMRDDHSVQFAYNNLVYSERFIKQIAEHFKYALDQILANENISIQDIAILTSTEQQMLMDFNATHVDYPHFKNVQQLFEDQERLTPEAVAVVFEGHQLTYQQLNEQSNRLAHHLLKVYEVKHGDKIGLMLERSAQVIVGLLGILKSGACYVPFDPHYPEERIRYMLLDSEIKVVLTEDKFVHSFQEYVQYFSLSAADETLKEYSSGNLAGITKPDDVAYMIYTSGSTGVPKGTMIGHKALTNLVLDHIRQMEITEKDNIVQFVSISFDVSLQDVFMALLSGARLTVVMQSTINDSYVFTEFIKNNGVTVMAVTPSFLSTLDRDKLRSLRVIITGGEPVNVADAVYFSSFLKYFNAYGPTEATVCTCVYQVSEADRYRTKMPIGRPITNTAVYILNSALRSVPINIPGEIYIGGEGLAKGYWKNEALTREKFIMNPFKPGERLYKSGDIGKWNEDGTVEFLGRKDTQVKIRGYRVELDEIAAAVQKVPDVKKALVIADNNQQHEQLVVVYYTSDKPLDGTLLKSHLAKWLPAYMVPSFFIELSEFPLSPNGKIDYHSLPAVDKLKKSSAYEVARTAKERQLVKIWQEVLVVEHVGIRDNFFDLGGHSLKAMQVVSRIHKELNYKLELKALFTHSNIADLCSIMEGSTDEYTGIEPVGEQAHYELSHGQRRLWMLSQFEESRLLYNVPSAHILEGSLNLVAFEKSFTTLISRHEILRTSFITVDGQPKQKIHATTDFPFKVAYMDYRGQAPTEAEEQIKKDWQIPFNLSTGPLLRVKLIHVTEARYFMMLTMHHIISDEWSMEVLVRELQLLYTAYCHGDENPLPPLSLQYKDYAWWQHTQLEDASLRIHQEYWLKQFNGTIPALELPLDYPRPVVRTSHGRQIFFTLEASLGQGLRELSRSNGASLHMTLLALINVLLYRYSGQRDIIIGTPVAGREHLNLEDQIGFYINMLAIRTRIEENWDFVKLLSVVKTTVLEGYSHQVYPFDRLVEELQLERDMSHNPLYDVGFTWHASATADASEPLTSDIMVKPFGVQVASSKADLWFHGSQEGDIIGMSVEYNTDLFGEDRMLRLGQHFHELVANVVSAPTTALCRLRYMAERERRLVLEELNNTITDYPREATIVSLFELQVKQTPDVTAIVFEGIELSYRELNERSNKLAHHLRKQFKPKSEELIGLMVNRSVEMVIGMLGILKSGGAYVPIDPSLPQARKSQMLLDSAVRLLLTDSTEMLDASTYYRGELFALDIELSGLSTPLRNPRSKNTCTNLAYQMYTSGSTGKPKGVMVEHRNIVRLVKDTNYADIHAGHRILQLSNYAFDGSVFDIFGALLNGATLYCISKEVLLNNDRLVKIIESEGINMMFITTALFNNLVELSVESLKQFEKIYFGGEEASLSHIRRAIEHRKREDSIVHVYGPTEGTTFSTYYPIRSLSEDSLSVPIGMPISNTTAYILDEHLEPVAIGITGEIYLGGEGLARGYWHSEEQTKQKFIPHPFGSADERLYKTGDMGRWTQEGAIEFLGRRDTQVKVRGHRIELGEIENVLSGHSGIKQAFVTTRENMLDSKELVAYYTSEGTASEKELHGYLAGKLPGYMVPQHFIEVERFPLNINGKIDRNALPDISDEESSRNITEPRTPLEEQVCRIWQEVLGREKIGVTDNFFGIGGDSIKAIRVVSMLNKSLQCHVEVKDIFIHEDIASLSIFIGQQNGSSDAVAREQAAMEIEEVKTRILNDPSQASQLPADMEDLYPMSDIEKGMVFHNLLGGASRVYIDRVYYQVEMKSFNFELFSKAFELLIEKYVILRTSFNISDFGEPIQIVHHASSVKEHIFYEDLIHHSVEDRDEYVGVFLMKYPVNGFDLDIPGLWTLRVFRLAEDEYGIAWILHHAILDGWSVSSLMTELSNLYTNLKQDENHLPVSLRASYKDYIIDQTLLKNSVSIQAYWKNHLNGYVRTGLPLGKKPKPKSTQVKENKNAQVFLDPELSRALLLLSERLEISIKNICLSAFVYLIKVTTNTDDITIGLISNARPGIEDGDKIIGCFLNTVPFRIKVPEKVSSSFIIEEVSILINHLKGNDKLSLQAITRLLGAESVEGNVMFDIIFDYLDFHITDQASQEVTLKKRNYDGGLTTNTFFDFIVQKFHNDALAIGINYEVSLYAEVEVFQILEYYKNILTCFAYETDIMTNDKVFPESEKHKILYSFNSTEIEFPGDKTIHELFEQQVINTPDAIALINEDKQFTYQQLNERANVLAHHLRKKYSIRQDDMIGIMADPAVETIIAILGVLKSGAAYVPIDITYPKERKSMILRDAAVKVLLLNSSEMFEVIAYYQGELFALDLELSGLEEIIQNPEKINTPADLAYMIYTSGSTGIPKGTMVEHKGIVNMCTDQIRKFNVTNKDRVLQFASLSFDASVSEIFMALNCGASLMVVSKEAKEDVGSFTDYLKKNSISIVTLPPVYLNALNLDELKSLRAIITAGEAAYVSDAAYCSKFLEYYNAYGPTEFSVCATIYRAGEDDKQKSSIPIGNPIANTAVYILSSSLELIPAGVTGELYLGGAGLARGYWNNEELTSEKFITNPFKSDERLYRTGDLGKWNEDGTIDFLGRKDSQVKIRGYRIELSEVEHIIQKISSIQKVVVTVKDDPMSGKSLMAFYSSGEKIDSAFIRTHLEEYLPIYMIPSYFIEVDEFLMTANGKIDLEGLPYPGGSDSETEYEAPGDFLESTLSTIWEYVLGRQKIGIHDNFFGLGGHSLKAMQVVSRIYRELNYKLDLDHIFTSPTIAELSNIIRTAEQYQYQEITIVEPQEYYELSHAQKRLWVLNQFEKRRVAYNIPGAYVLEGSLNRSALETSFNALVNRHESLRTTFLVIGDNPVQKIHRVESFEFKLSYVDLRNSAEAEKLAAELAQQEAATTFDLEKGPLLRAKLLQLTDEKYILLFTVHHIIFDGWSMEIIVRELSALYNAFCLGEKNPLSPLPIQYKDYAHWQNQKLLGDDLNIHRKYWYDQFAGELPTLLFPTDYVRPIIKTYRGDRIDFLLDESQSNGVIEMSKQHGASLFMTLVSLVKALLYRYTGQEDIIIGSPIAGREHVTLEDQVGLYINTLAIRTRFSGEESFSKLLNEVKDNILNSYVHQIYPFDKLVDELPLLRDTSRSALFDVMIVLQNTEHEGNSSDGMHGINVFNYGQSLKASKFDLNFSFKEIGHRLAGSIEYNTDIFKSDRIERMINHLRGILSEVLRNDQIPLCKLNFMGDEEKRCLLVDFNPSESYYPKHDTIHALFEKQVFETPDAIALVDEEKQLTYRQLNEESNKVAHHLRNSYGIGPNDFVGVMIRPSVKMICGLLGILKSGGSYVPIDPAYPVNRKSFIVQDSNLKVLLTEEDLVIDFEVKSIEIEDKAICNESIENPLTLNSSADTMYLIYTSGTTGVPKGTMIAHHSVVNFCWWMVDLIYKNHDAPLTTMVTAPITFDASIRQFTPLICGSTLVVVKEETKKDPRRYVDALIKFKVDVFNITPTYLNVVLSTLKERQMRPQIRYTFVGGEALSAELHELYYEVMEESTLINCYGPTETVANVTFKVMHERRPATITIGKAISNAFTYIVDKHLEVVPIGVIGELLVGGAGVAKGYLNREELSKERFIANPFRPGERVYKTGDLARWLPNGEIEFLGRRDHQIKLRGFRIELSEIESVLMRYDGVENAMVMVNEEDLIAFVISKLSLNASDLHAYMATHLPDYMLPSFYVQVNSFPQTISGKIDREALLELSSQKLPTGTNHVKPQNETEELLLTIWKSVLSREQISVTDNFFTIGGHSIKAVQIIFGINKKLQINIGMGTIFTHPTIRLLSQVIDQSKQEILEPIPPLASQSVYELSHAQRRLWLFEQVESGSTAYHVPGAYVLQGDFDKGVFEKAYQKLIERHESLRTTFIVIEGEPRQKIHPSQTVVPYFKYMELNAEENPSNTIKNLVNTEVQTVFDLERGPLIRVTIIKTGDAHHVFLLSMHHIISDGWSMKVLYRELMQLYETYLQGNECDLAPLKIQYKDYAAWHNKQLMGERLTVQRNYWLKQLSGEIPVLEIPTDYSRPFVKTYEGNNLNFVLPTETSEKLNALCKDNQTTLFTMLVTVVNILLYKYTGQRDIIIGATVAGRDHPELDNQIGFYVNMLPLRTHIDSHQSFTAMLADVKDITLQAYEHQLYPLNMMINDLNLEVDLGRSPLFDVIITLQNADIPDDNIRASGKALSVEGLSENLDMSSSKYDITFGFIEIGNEIGFSIKYNTQLFSKETIHQTGQDLLKIIQCVVFDPGVNLSTIELYSSLTPVQLNSFITE